MLIMFINWILLIVNAWGIFDAIKYASHIALSREHFQSDLAFWMFLILQLHYLKTIFSTNIFHYS